MSAGHLMSNVSWTPDVKCQLDTWCRMSAGHLMPNVSWTPDVKCQLDTWCQMSAGHLVSNVSWTPGVKCQLDTWWQSSVIHVWGIELIIQVRDPIIELFTPSQRHHSQIRENFASMDVSDQLFRELQELWVFKIFKRIASFNCYGLGSCREYVAELVKQYDLVALQETWLFPWDLAVPSTCTWGWCEFFLTIVNWCL